MCLKGAMQDPCGETLCRGGTDKPTFVKLNDIQLRTATTIAQDRSVVRGQWCPEWHVFSVTRMKPRARGSQGAS